MEKEVPRVAPRAETDWDFAAALRAGSVRELEKAIGHPLLPLRALAGRLAPAAVGALPWSPLVFATGNFAYAAELPAEADLNEYLRPVGDLLLLPGAAGSGSNSEGDPTSAAGFESDSDAATESASAGSESGSDAGARPAAGSMVVLLSEREANGLFEALWPGSSASNRLGKAGGGGTAPLLVSMPYACSAQHDGPLRVAACASWDASRQLAAQLPAGRLRPQLASLQLFNGETTFVPPQQLVGLEVAAWWGLPTLAALRALVAGQRAAAEALVAMRGKQVLFAYSQLELACDAEHHGGGAA